MSEQNLVDCVTLPKYNSSGCKGGRTHQAFAYVKDNGIESESNYPYNAKQGPCHFDKNKTIARITDFHIDHSRNEEVLKNAVATIGPIAVGIKVVKSLSSYRGGIYHATDCQGFMNHGVLAVGYGTEKGQDYWLIKNTWGVKWGISGYLKLARNKDNMCAIGKYQTYPIF